MAFPSWRLRLGLTAGLAAALSAAGGCAHRDKAAAYYEPPAPPPMLGAAVDELNRAQEENAEAAKFIIYQHEFQMNEVVDGRNVGGVRLNEYGEDHVKRIADALKQGVPWPVVVERSQTSARPDTEFHYPVHFNPELDLKRREVVVRALVRMGVADAEERVVVAPSFAHPITSEEAERAYYRGTSGRTGAGFGGGFGGFGAGGFGGIGGFGF
jgi:hypothetical protein